MATEPTPTPDPNRFRLTPEELRDALDEAKRIIEANEKYLRETYGPKREPKTRDEEILARMD